MARVNVEESAFVAARTIAKSIGMDEDAILGKLVKFWHDTQSLETTTGSGEEIARWLGVEHQGAELLAKTIDSLERTGLIKSDEKRGEFTIVGNSKHIKALRKLREGGKKGGRASAKARLKPGSSQASSPAQARVQSSPQASLEPNTIQFNTTQYSTEREREKSALARAASISFSEAEKNECIEAWGQTLQKFGIQKPPKLDEVGITRLLIAHGHEKTLLALRGAAYEERSKDYDPSKHVSIRRFDKAANFEKFVNLGASNKAAASRRVCDPGDPNDVERYEREYKKRQEALGG